MTDEPRHDYQASPGYAPAGDASGAHPAEPWGNHAEVGGEPGHAEATVSHPEPVKGPRMWPRIVGVLLLFVIAGGVWLWQNPGLVQSSLRWALPGYVARESAATETEINTLDGRVARLEQGLPAGLAALTQRLDTLEKRPPGTGQTTQAPAADLRPLLARLETLEARVAAGAPTGSTPAAPIAGGPDAQSLAARMERQQAEEAANAARIEALQARINALSARNSADLSSQLDAVEHRLGELAANQSKLAGTSDRVSRLAQVNAAEMALAAGRPLGSIPNAPAALARFATTAPPTEPGLRLAFAAASQQALQVSLPDTEGKPLFDRVLSQLQDFRLITVREGDHVVIGNSTAAILAHARVLLDVGDLSGATKAVASLSGPPAAKMASWLADATALQSAREALASLAENG